MISRIPKTVIAYWSHLMYDQIFESEQEARNEVFRICEQQSRQSWSTPIGKNTIPENRKFSKALPLYKIGNQWKVGSPVQEYLSSNTSDFSDGTNGEPSGYPPSEGGVGSPTGLPDYKQIEKHKIRRDHLKILAKQRNPVNEAKEPTASFDNEFDPKEVEPDPVIDYTKYPIQTFGWFLNLGSENDIERRAYQAGIQLNADKWETLSIDYADLEQRIVRLLNDLNGVNFRDEGHSEEGLVGSGWITPYKQPELWWLLIETGEQQPINILKSYAFGIKPNALYYGTRESTRKLLIPEFYVFGIRPDQCPECRSRSLIPIPGLQDRFTGKDNVYQCDNCGHRVHT